MTHYQALAWDLDGQTFCLFRARTSRTEAALDAQLSGFPLSLIKTLKGS